MRGRFGFNESEAGSPIFSNYGQTLGNTRIVPIPTVLPGPEHFTDQFGAVRIGTYKFVSPYRQGGFAGEVPLSMSPEYPRRKAWEEK